MGLNHGYVIALLVAYKMYLVSGLEPDNQQQRRVYYSRDAGKHKVQVPGYDDTVLEKNIHLRSSS